MTFALTPVEKKKKIISFAMHISQDCSTFPLTLFQFTPTFCVETAGSPWMWGTSGKGQGGGAQGFYRARCGLVIPVMPGRRIYKRAHTQIPVGGVALLTRLPSKSYRSEL